jgi:hypothetical protein
MKPGGTSDGRRAIPSDLAGVRARNANGTERSSVVPVAVAAPADAPPRRDESVRERVERILREMREVEFAHPPVPRHWQEAAEDRGEDDSPSSAD